MGGTQTAAVVAVKVFEEWNVIAKVWVSLELVVATERGPAALRIAKKDPGQATGDLVGDGAERGEPA